MGEVVAGLLCAFAGRTDVDPIPYALSWRGREELAAALPDGMRGVTRPFPARIVRSVWERGMQEPRVERWTGTVDVVHALNYVGPPAHAPVLVTVHDLTFLRFPEMCTRDTLRYPQLIRRALDRGATIHAVSHFVADEIREAFSIEPERVVTVHNGITNSMRGDPASGALAAGGERYVLALGTVEPRKNLPALVRAFAALAGADLDIRLVIAGGNGWGSEELTRAIDASKVRNRITRLGYVTTTQRNDLLAGATVFAYPSIYEGFGLPPLEAMAAGVPVVASSAGSLPEVLGSAAHLVDPFDDEALAAALTQMSSDSEARTRHIDAGLDRVRLYSWDAAAAELIDLYKRLV